jgi:hypothetical protein
VQSGGSDIIGPAGIALGCNRTNISKYGFHHSRRP